MLDIGYVMVGLLNKILRRLVLSSVTVEIDLKKILYLLCLCIYLCFTFCEKAVFGFEYSFLLNHLLQAFNQNGLISNYVNFDI